MSNTALPRIGDAATQDLINRLEVAINALEATPLAGVVVLPSVTFGAGDLRVYHGLGRAVRGYFVVRCAVTGVTVGDGLTPETIDPRNYVSLRASAAVALTLAVF